MSEAPEGPAVVTHNAVVVESGPVAYEDPGEEEDEDEDEQCVSAMQLMGGDGQSASAHVLTSTPFNDVDYHSYDTAI